MSFQSQTESLPIPTRSPALVICRETKISTLEREKATLLEQVHVLTEKIKNNDEKSFSSNTSQSRSFLQKLFK